MQKKSVPLLLRTKRMVVVVGKMERWRTHRENTYAPKVKHSNSHIYLPEEREREKQDNSSEE